jgi:hypothetical protein
MKRILVIVLLSLSGTTWPQVVNIAGTTRDSASRESLRVPISGVISVSLPSGQRALIQFTKFHDSAAEYRWKYRPKSGGNVQIGTGMVIEKYERMAPVNDGSYPVLPLPGHDVIVRAGEIRAEYSPGSAEYCYFYFNPKRAKAVLLKADAFGKDL